MKFITLSLEDTMAYERGIDGATLITTYGKDLAPLMYDYMRTSDPVIFDKNKDLIADAYKKVTSTVKPKTQIDLFFYRLKKIIYLTDEFKKHGKWNNPIVVRTGASRHKVVSVGLDRWHVMRNFRIKEYDFLYLSNIEFSIDFQPKLAELYTPDTEFDFYYVEESRRYKFEIKPKFNESPNFNLERWLKLPYIEGQPSAIVAQPNRVTLRDAAIERLRGK